MRPARKGIFMFSRIADTPVPIRVRFMGFVFLLVCILFLLFIMILYLTGSVTAGQKEAGEYFAGGLSRAKADVELDFGRTSMQAIEMSGTVTSSVEKYLSDFGIKPSELKSHPEILEKLLDDQFERLSFQLEKSGTSGAFIILDATVNPNLENASMSRAALYVRNMEPNAVSAGTPNMTMLHGFPDIARDRGYSLNSIWAMEFDLSLMPEYEEIRVASQSESSLNRLYLWGESRPLSGSSEDIMLCIVPLIDGNGQFFGVCGFEVSGMLFKLRYSPETAEYKRVTSLMCPGEAVDGLMVGKSLCGGDDNSIRTILSDTNSDPSRTAMKVAKRNRDVNIYRFASSDKTVVEALRSRYFVGLHETVTLLPSDSAFKDHIFTLMLLMPESEYSYMLGKNNVKIVSLCSLFILVGAIMAVLLSRKFTAPILKDLSRLASGTENEDSDPMKTPEIMAILDQIRSRHPQKRLSDAPDQLFDDFLGKIRHLTPTEKQIVLRFLEDKSTQDILAEMFISTSTLKTHNSHIYAKLDVVSRDELQLYFRLLDKTGRLDDLRMSLTGKAR